MFYGYSCHFVGRSGSTKESRASRPSCRPTVRPALTTCQPRDAKDSARSCCYFLSDERRRRRDKEAVIDENFDGL